MMTSQEILNYNIQDHLSSLLASFRRMINFLCAQHAIIDKIYILFIGHETHIIYLFSCTACKITSNDTKINRKSINIHSKIQLQKTKVKAFSEPTPLYKFFFRNFWKTEIGKNFQLFFLSKGGFEKKFFLMKVFFSE